MMKPFGPALAAGAEPLSESNLWIGIDVGGTWIKGAFIDVTTGTPDP
ncbi:hypothetical protein [uncultured Arthrobacter sp.]|nr:hypothetical protein [uncultured Arthrobacter sp.]